MGASDLQKSTELDLSVSRWGNSLAVRLPARLVKDLGLQEGSRIKPLQLGERLVLLAQPEQESDELLVRKQFLAELAELHKRIPMTQPVSKDEMSRY